MVQIAGVVEIDFDGIEGDAWAAARSGKPDTDCPYHEGSVEREYWLLAFEEELNRPAAMAFDAGRLAASRGKPFQSCGESAPAMLAAWRKGWQFEANGPFAGMRGIQIEGRTDLLLD